MATIEPPLAPGNRLQRAFASRIEALDEATRCALLIAAVEPGGDLATITVGCGQAGTDIGRLVGAESAGLVHLGAVVTFAHPLVRGAVYELATPAQRRAVHAALARVTRAERRTWHLASATIGPDDDVATELARLGIHSNQDFLLARYRADGTIDTTFGSGGHVTTDVGGGDDFAENLAVDSQGRIIIVGRAASSTILDLALARYTSGGKLDASFDGDGILTADFHGQGEFGQDVALDASGRIVAAGYTANGADIQFALMRVISS